MISHQSFDEVMACQPRMRLPGHELYAADDSHREALIRVAFKEICFEKR